MQNFVKRATLDILINKEMLSTFHTVAKKCHNVRVPQPRSSPDHIQELFFFLERKCHHADVSHS